MNEKRYFVIQNSQINLGNQNKYILLYNFLLRKKNIEENDVKEFLTANNYSVSNVSADISYLYKSLLKSLSDFHSKSIMNLKTMESIAMIEMLFFKGLYESCLDEISKLKRSSELKENPYLMLNLLNWEKKCKGYSMGLLEAIMINQSMSSNIDELDKIKIVTDLYYRTYYLKNNVGNFTNEKIEIELNEIINHPILKENNSFEPTLIIVFYELIYANYFHIRKNYDQELTYLKGVIKLYNENIQFRYENPLDFIAIYIRLINILKHKNIQEFYEHVLKLRAFDHFLDIQKGVVKERIWLFTNMAELDYYLMTLEFSNNQEKINTFKNELIQTKYQIEPFYMISFYYLLASIYCYLNDFSEALKLVNKVLNEYSFKDNPKGFLQTEFLNYIIHFELKNYDYVLHQMQLNKRRYHLKEFNSKLQRKLILGYYNICLNGNYHEVKNVYKKIIKKYENKSAEIGVRDKNMLNYLKMKLE